MVHNEILDSDNSEIENEGEQEFVLDSSLSFAEGIAERTKERSRAAKTLPSANADSFLKSTNLIREERSRSARKCPAELDRSFNDDDELAIATVEENGPRRKTKLEKGKKRTVKSRKERKKALARYEAPEVEDSTVSSGILHESAACTAEDTGANTGSTLNSLSYIDPTPGLPTPLSDKGTIGQRTGSATSCKQLLNSSSTFHHADAGLLSDKQASDHVSDTSYTTSKQNPASSSPQATEKEEGLTISPLADSTRSAQVGRGNHIRKGDSQIEAPMARAATENGSAKRETNVESTEDPAKRQKKDYSTEMQAGQTCSDLHSEASQPCDAAADHNRNGHESAKIVNYAAIGGQPLSKRTAMGPRYRVGLSKRIKVESLHANITRKYP